MIKKIKSLIFIFIFLITVFFSVYFSLVSLDLMKAEICTLTRYCLQPLTHRYPAGWPEFFLLHFRGGKKDVHFLNQYSGLAFLFLNPYFPKEKVYKYSVFLLSKGVKINLIDSEGFTALHRSIYLNQPGDVSFLLKNGANINVEISFAISIGGAKIKPDAFGMNAVKFAGYLSNKDKKDRSKIIKILTEFS